ncbi:MAG TPA: hypothetical protein DEA22_02485 [Blastocatellia bacterium]|nr:hypothetical protein [Blastocatellia bacterium]
MQVTGSESISLSSQPAGAETTSKKIFKGIIEAARESVIIIDSSMRIAAASSAAQAAFARDAASIEGHRLTEVIRDLSLHASFHRALAENARTEARLEYVTHEKRGYDVHITPVEIEGKLYAVGVFYDTTRIERLEKMRQEFLSNISHELRTPLTSIMAFVETLESGAIDDPENNRRFLGVVRRNAQRMNDLISDILELSMIESGKITIEIKSVKLANLVDEIFASLSSKAAERDIGLINEIEAEARVPADQMRLEQMLTNLIDNAIKFNRPAGTVSVRMESNDGKYRIEVSDTGEGILPSHLPRIFERFYRADRGRTREVGGTGLGLSIVKHLARLHGGDVSAFSDLGRGSRFIIELPGNPGHATS